MLNTKSMYSPLDLRIASWLFSAINGSDMKKINLVEFYNFGRWIGHLRLIKSGQLSADEFHFLNQAKGWLEMACRENNSLVVPFDICMPAMKNLSLAVGSVLNQIILAGPAVQITQQQIDDIGIAMSRFETVFADESPTFATYFVSQKRAYSTRHLIEKAENAFSDEIKEKLPAQCVFDIHEAGKCIAFELATAAGFHSVRALEALALDYVNKRKLTPKHKDLGEYLRVLKENGADQRAITIVDQIRGMRRNPIVHPKDNLQLDDAITVFQLCTSAMNELVADMEKCGMFN